MPARRQSKGLRSRVTLAAACDQADDQPIDKRGWLFGSEHARSISCFKLLCACFALAVVVAIRLLSGASKNDPQYLHEDKVRLDDTLSVKQHSPIRFKNLLPEIVDVWWVDDSSMTIVHQYTLSSGEQISTLGLVGSTFFFSPQDDPSKQLQVHIVDPGDNSDHLFVLEDQQNSDSVLMQKWKAENAYRMDYFHKTGRRWLGYYPKDRPGHHMWPARHVGDIEVLSTDAGQYHCIPMVDSSCRPAGGLNLSVEVVATEPKVFLVENFLSATEADHLVKLGAQGMHRSKTTHNANGTVSTVRTSSQKWVTRDSDSITERIIQRLAAVAKIPDHKMVHTRGFGALEAVQIVHYRSGQEYQLHYDWWVSESKEKHSRFMTFLLYLNDKAHADAGGDTVFPKCKCGGVNCTLSLHPGKGGAAFFYNLREDGNPDGLSMHAATPVREGEKWFANAWIWDPHISS